MSSTSSSAVPRASRPKRRRSSQPESGVSAAASQDASAGSVQAVGSASKRRKDEPSAVSADESATEGSAADTSKEAEVEGDPEAMDGGVDAVHARATRARGKTRLLSAEEKRNRFLAKYAGKTPEQILGEQSFFLRGPLIIALMSCAFA